MAMRHVRQREHRKRRMELEAHLNKERSSKTDRVLLILSKTESLVFEQKRGKKTSSVQRKKSSNHYSEFGISAHGREKRKGKSMPPREVRDLLF